VMRLEFMRPRHAIVFIAFALLLPACDESRQSTRAEHAAVALEPLDLDFESGSPVTATFRGPRGTTLTLESFPKAGKQVVRITAPEAGRWSYTVKSNSRVIENGALEAAPPRGKGFIRVRGHSYIYENGEPFIAIGENRINLYDPWWNWKRLSIEDYLAHMARHGMSVVRVFIVSDIENEADGTRNAGVLEPTLGRFDEATGEQFDRIFRAAQSHGISVVLVAFALGFSENDDWKSWRDNPYSAERGGPAATRYEFFESPAVRAQAAQRVRYLAARYAAFPNLLAIDLLNEPEWDGAIPEVSWAAWAESLAQEWRKADPYRHPVTVGSVGLHWNIEGDEREWWSTNACDIVQWHLYGPEVYDVHALAAEMTRKVTETWSYGKPVLVGEFAYGGEAKPEYDHTHVGLWSASFSGAGVLAHSAPAFNVDSDELMTPERARHFVLLRRVLAGVPNPEPVRAQLTGSGTAWALLSENAAAAWILAAKNTYEAVIDGQRLTVPVRKAGEWHVEWLDDVTGKELAKVIHRTTQERLELTVPPYHRHVVAQLRWHAP
jgi:hypothetical protein